MGLNPDSGPSFVATYIDDILVFSDTLKDHLNHLCLVLERRREVNLKLKPTKCRFARKEVEYLGHVLTPDGLKPNPALVSAVRVSCSYMPQGVKEISRTRVVLPTVHSKVRKRSTTSASLDSQGCPLRMDGSCCRCLRGA